MKGNFQKVISFLKLLATRFFLHQGLENAAALTYTTLLSIVPLMTVVFAILSAFPLADRMGEAMRDFVFQNFVPASGVVVQQYLEEFISKASKLSGASFVLLIFVALMMMTNIERALNRIWESHRKRSPVNRFLVYWALLSLGPALVAISLAATSYLVSLPLIVEAEQSYGLGKRLLVIMPVLASMIAFILMYVVIPNHRVPLRYAMIGGLVGALLFAVANRAFGWFVTSFPSYEAIYGALAVIPVFLVWVFFSWVIFLLGAEFTHCLEECRYCSTDTSERNTLRHAILILQKLRSGSGKGEQLTDRALLDVSQGLGVRQRDAMLEKLEAINLVVQTADENWTLARDLRTVTLFDLYRQLDTPLPRVEQKDPDSMLDNVFEQAYQGLEKQLSVTLEDVVSENLQTKKTAAVAAA